MNHRCSESRIPKHLNFVPEKVRQSGRANLSLPLARPRGL